MEVLPATSEKNPQRDRAGREIRVHLLVILSNY